MKYRSTRENSPSVTLSEAIGQGLAPDGGLYVPTTWPKISIDRNLSELPFDEFATKILSAFFAEDALGSVLANICKKAFSFPLPLIPLKDSTCVLELFHGPTSAFKDFGARFLALCLDAIKDQGTQPRRVLVATSGDTGGAVAAAFHECTNIPVTILYPKGKISQRQEKQLTVWGDRVQAYAVRGTFDDCQRIVKEAFLDRDLRAKFQLISANSINIGRLLPQMAYSCYAACVYSARFGSPPGLIIPSGNVGNSVGALWAKKLGFPIREVVFSHNANQTVSDYFSTGNWLERPSVQTLANAMDVGNPSNFERVLSLYPHLEELKSVASCSTTTDQEIEQEIREGMQKWGQIWCPHTATAAHARNRQKAPHWILYATAHPAKFESIVEPLIGQKVTVPPKLAALLQKNSKQSEIGPDFIHFKQHLLAE